MTLQELLNVVAEPSGQTVEVSDGLGRVITKGSKKHIEKCEEILDDEVAGVFAKPTSYVGKTELIINLKEF